MANGVEGVRRRHQAHQRRVADIEVNPTQEVERLLHVQRSFAGPLPAPEDLAQYEQILPGMAERILAMAEKTATGQIDIDTKLADAEVETAKTGQAIAALLTFTALIAAIVFFAIGNPIAGGCFLSFPVVMMIRTFFSGGRGKDQQPQPDPGPAA